MDNNINADTILAVVRKLIGNTEPYGDSAIDCNRTENLDNLIHVIDGLLCDVEEVAVYKERNESSMQMMGKKADEALTDWHAYIEKYLLFGNKGEPMNKNTVENCCKNCEYSGNYDGWNEFICKYYNGMIRGEQYDCEGFEPEGEPNE